MDDTSANIAEELKRKVRIACREDPVSHLAEVDCSTLTAPGPCHTVTSVTGALCVDHNTRQ